MLVIYYTITFVIVGVCGILGILYSGKNPKHVKYVTGVTIVLLFIFMFLLKQEVGKEVDAKHEKCEIIEFPLKSTQIINANHLGFTFERNDTLWKYHFVNNEHHLKFELTSN